MDNAERLMFLGWAKTRQFKAKVDQAKTTIKDALEIDTAYVACSWGKDSTVLTHLCQQVNRDIPVISFGNPERVFFDYQEVIDRYCNQYHPNLITIELEGDHVPDKVKAAKLWETYPVAIVGVRKEESKARSIAITQYGSIYQFKSGSHAKSWRCFPLAYWNWKDVWAYIVSCDLPYLDAYNHQDWERGRTTDHLTKSTRSRWQRTRAEEFTRVSPDYYHYLKTHFPEMFQ